MTNEKRTYKGIGITGGRIGGRLHFINNVVKTKKSPEIINVGEELIRLESARKKALERVWQIADKAREKIGHSEAQIFEIHAMLLEDEDLNESILEKIKSGNSAEDAINEASEEYARMLINLGDEYLSGRASDIRDIASQLISALDERKKTENSDTEPYILVANDLTPSQTVMLDKNSILGFVTSLGTPSSHTAILARAMNIPALVGAGDIDKCYEGAFCLLDSLKGEIIINPTKQEIEEFNKEKTEQSKIAIEHERYLRSIMNKPAVTGSGHKIMIYANIGDVTEISTALSNGCEGIGLLRSEFLYLSKSTYPSEAQLFSAYKEIAEKMGGRRVIIRTLDIGADKQADYFGLEKEENPALGLRGIRLCLERREMFKKQLRAILRASYYGRVAIMIPMISCESEINEVKNLIKECEGELKKENLPFDEKIELGIMIETPASAIMSDKLSAYVDFFSVGTNDLTQYTLAADRQNSRVAHICEHNIEPIIRLIEMSAQAIKKKGGWIGICGEMAADLSLTQEFARIGIDELSVSTPYLLGVRGKVSECK